MCLQMLNMIPQHFCSVINSGPALSPGFPLSSVAPWHPYKSTTIGDGPRKSTLCFKWEMCAVPSLNCSHNCFWNQYNASWYISSSLTCAHSGNLFLERGCWINVISMFSSKDWFIFPLPFPLWNIFFINDLWNHTEEMLPLEAGSPSPPWVRIVIWVMLLLAGVRWLWLWHFHSHLRSSVWTCKQIEIAESYRCLGFLFTCWAKWLMSLQCCHLPIPKNVFEVFTPKNSSYLRAAIYDKCLYDFTQASPPFAYLSIHETVKKRHHKPLQHKRHLFQDKIIRVRTDCMYSPLKGKQWLVLLTLNCTKHHNNFREQTSKTGWSCRLWRSHSVADLLLFVNSFCHVYGIHFVLHKCQHST